METEDDFAPAIIFAGDGWEAGLLQTMLEDAGIEAFILDQFVGTVAPWVAAPGGAGAVKVAVARKDLDIALPVVQEFEKNRPK
jgi:hypothetical protein